MHHGCQSFLPRLAKEDALFFILSLLFWFCAFLLFHVSGVIAANIMASHSMVVLQSPTVPLFACMALPA
jgi:hypothetical protein